MDAAVHDFLRWDLNPSVESHPLPFPLHKNGVELYSQGTRSNRLLYRYGQDPEGFQVHVYHCSLVDRNADIHGAVCTSGLADCQLFDDCSCCESIGLSLSASSRSWVVLDAHDGIGIRLHSFRWKGVMQIVNFLS